MSDRERWTVYPLIFLALGLALKDKVTKWITTETIVCRQLVVTDKQNVHQIELGSTPHGGLIRTIGKPLNVLVGHTTPMAGLIFADSADNVYIPASVTVPNAVRNSPSQQKASPPEQPKPESAPR